MKSPKLALIAITLAALLTACSGGGGNTTAPSDSTTGGTDGGTTTTTTDGTTTTLVTTTCTPSPALPSQYSRVFKGCDSAGVAQYYVVSYRATQQTILSTATRHNLEILGNQRDYLALQMEQIEALASNLGQVDEISRSLAAINSASDTSTYDRLPTNARIGYLLSN